MINLRISDINIGDMIKFKYYKKYLRKNDISNKTIIMSGLVLEKTFNKVKILDQSLIIRNVQILNIIKVQGKNEVVRTLK